MVSLWAAVLAGCSADSPEQARLGVPRSLDPETAALIERLLDNVEAHPGDSSPLVDLCLAYEANQLWLEARKCYQRALRVGNDVAELGLHLALVTRNAGRLEESHRLLERFARDHPSSAPLQHWRAETLLEKGELETAMTAFQRLIELQPGAPQGHAGVGAVLLQEGRYREAIPPLEEAVRRGPGYGAVRYSLGTAYRSAGRLEEAQRELSQGLGSEVLFLPDSLSRRLEQYRVNTTDRLARAAEELRRGDPGQAAALLEKAVAAQPKNVTVLNNLAVAYLRLGRLEEAETVLERARRTDPDKFSTYLNLASLARRRGHFEDALRWAEEAVARAPDLAQSHYARAQAMAELGRFEQALDSVERVIAIDANQSPNHTFAGDLCLQLRRHEPAREHFLAALEIEPRFLPALLGLLQATWALGLQSEAREALSEARRLAPKHPRVREWIGRLERG